MPGIYIMAALTLLGTAMLCIAFLNTLTHSDRRFYYLLLAGLPLSFIVNRWVKIPVLAAVAGWAGVPLKLGPAMPVWFIGLILVNAPLFEEAIKLLPLALPASRRYLRSASSSLWAGLATGLGFGLGEAAFLAYGIAQSPEFSALPWYLFSGFASERLIVTFGHGFLTSLAFLGFHYGGRKALAGYLSAAGLHALINLGPILLALRLIPEAVSSLVSYAAILAAFLIFQKNLRTAKRMNGTPSDEIIYFER